MVIEYRKNYNYVYFSKDSFNKMKQDFDINYNNLINNHIIIQFCDKVNIEKENILLFLNYSFMHKKKGMSFVIINKNIDIDNFEKLNIVCSLQEAEDLVELENIQRDLGVFN